MHRVQKSFGSNAINDGMMHRVTKRDNGVLTPRLYIDGYIKAIV